MVLNILLGLLCIVLVLFIVYVFLQIIESMLSSYLHTSISYLIYIISTRQFSHFLEKTRLVTGDLVIVRFRGKYRKATIKTIAYLMKEIKFQLTFEEESLNTKEMLQTWFPIDRIIVPEFLGKTAKLLFSEMEIKRGK